MQYAVFLWDLYSVSSFFKVLSPKYAKASPSFVTGRFVLIGCK